MIEMMTLSIEREHIHAATACSLRLSDHYHQIVYQINKLALFSFLFVFCTHSIVQVGRPPPPPMLNTASFVLAQPAATEWRYSALSLLYRC